jgi:hypothetical protein
MIWIPVAITVVTLGGLYAALRFGSPACPGCRKRQLVVDPDHQLHGSQLNAHDERVLDSVGAYRCRSCGAEWRCWDGGALITREAFEAGAVAPPPVAIVRTAGVRTVVRPEDER